MVVLGVIDKATSTQTEYRTKQPESTVMKKKIAMCLAALAAFTFTFGGEIKDAVFTELLRLTVKELVTPQFIARALESRKHNFGGCDVNFHDAYYQARETAYGSTPWGKECFEKPSRESYEVYNTLKVVLVASLKKQLHDGTTLMDTYSACRESFKTSLAGETPELRKSLLKSVTGAIETFEKVKSAKYRDELQALATQEVIRLYGFDQSKIEEMLAKNVDAEAIIEQVKLQQKLEAEPQGSSGAVDAESTRDRDLEKFALRRFNEGGERLIDKYLAVARLAEEDIKTTIVNIIIKETSTP